jgi:hypothetical protein
MLRTILYFVGLTASAAPAAPPARPLSKRSDIPVGRCPTPRPTIREAEASADRTAAFIKAQAARDARNATVLAEQMSAAEDVRFADAFRLISRAHDRTYMMNIDARHVAAAEVHLGVHTAEYMRACRFAGVRLTLISDGMPAPRLAAFRQELLSRTATDFVTWEQGDTAVSKARDEAKRHGEPIPPHLEMPAEVVAGILRIQKERLDRLQKRSGGRAGTGTETATATVTDSSATTPIGTTTEPLTEEPETYTPPGPK